MENKIVRIIRNNKTYYRIHKWKKKKKKLTRRYTFENRMKEKEKVCFVLAGYKEFCYEIVFKRIKTFVPNDVEVCILSSGIYSKELSKLAEKNDWSYLSTRRNCVTLIQNVAINKFKKAKYIYKIDEDIFVTKNFFETMYDTLINSEKDINYQVGFVSPIIPINGVGYNLILEKYKLKNVYEKRFEKPMFSIGNKAMIETNPNTAKFMWGEGNYLPNIDDINYDCQKDKKGYYICPIKLSIGAILFKRELFEKMGMFNVGNGIGMGKDEQQICNYCMNNSYAIVISKNSVVGHLSFGEQNKDMEEYYKNNKTIFEIHQK